MVDYLIPKTFSLDNYAFLFEGSNFFSWCGKAMLLAAAVALAATLLTHFLGRSLDRADASRGKTTLTLGAAMAVCYAALAIAAGAVHGQALGQRLVPALLGLVLFTAAGVIFARIYLKQDDKLLRTLPGYMAEDRHEGAKKVATLAAELWALALLCQCIVAPMQASQYIRWYGNTLTIALFTAVIQTVIVLSVSYALSRLRFKGRKLIMNTVLVLGLFPGFLTMITLYFLLKQMGLTQAGAVPGLILIYCASSGMGYYISKGFFDTIPKSLDESARIDGATRFQVFLKIIMPLAKPIVIYTVLMAFRVRQLRGLRPPGRLQRGRGPVQLGEHQRLPELLHPLLRGRRAGGGADHGAVHGAAKVLCRRRHRRRGQGMRRNKYGWLEA